MVLLVEIGVCGIGDVYCNCILCWCDFVVVVFGV